MSEEEEILKQTRIEEETSEKLLAEKLAEKKKQQNKKRLKIGGGIVFFIFVVWAYKWLFAPFQLSLPYGLCKAYLEYNVPYPHTIYVSEAQTLADGSVRIWFSQIDPFGVFRMQPFHCFYIQDPQTGALRFSKIKYGKVDLPDETIAEYNKTIDIMASMSLDLNYPSPLPNSIEDLRFETDSFRKIQLNTVRKY